MTVTGTTTKSGPGAARRVRLGHVGRAVAPMAGTAVVAEIVLAVAGGAGAAAVGAAAIVVVALLIARYVAGAEAMDGSYRRSVRLVSQREPSLQGWASAVDAARESAAGFERVLRPQLERLYAVRLADRYGVSLYHEPERAEAIVGAEVFAWIDPRRAPYLGSAPRLSLDRRAQQASDTVPPVPDRVIRALVDRLEAL